jgi:hypothetical protein
MKTWLDRNVFPGISTTHGISALTLIPLCCPAFADAQKVIGAGPSD